MCVCAKWLKVVVVAAFDHRWNKDVRKLTDKKVKQRSPDAVESMKKRHSVSSEGEAEMEGEDEVREWRCM